MNSLAKVATAPHCGLDDDIVEIIDETEKGGAES